jgi:hypothetical protein
VFGATSDPDMATLRTRWHSIVDVSPAADDSRRVGLATDGVVPIRPAGYLGFRAVPADHAGIGAVESHLGTYLMPTSG